jgi:hypothetical protein
VGFSLVCAASLEKGSLHVQVLSQMMHMVVYWGN